MLTNLYFQKYKITKIINESPYVNNYIARDLEHENTSFIINEIHDIDFIKNNLKDFLCLKNQNSLNDYVDCICEDSKLYLVFKHIYGQPLLKYLKENTITFDLKVKLVQDILLNFSHYSDSPQVIQQIVLNPMNIMIENNQLYFNYCLHDSIIKYTFLENDIYNALNLLISCIFSEKEIEEFSKLKIILVKLDKKLYSSTAEVIKDFDEIVQDRLKEISFKEAVLLKRKKFLSSMQKVSFTLLTLVCIVVFVNSYLKPKSSPTDEYTPIEQIGTVKVETTIDSDTNKDSDNNSTQIQTIIIRN